MSASKKEKDGFDWLEGDVLHEDEYAPVGEVRAKGLPKLKTATHADPVKRKHEREQVISQKHLEPYQARVPKGPAKDMVFEESESGLSEGYEGSEAKKLIDQGKGIKGLGRFGRQKNPKK